MSRARGLFKPGVVALLSVAAIAAILVFAHFDRQARAFDEMAQRAAMRAHALLVAAKPADPTGQAGPAIPQPLSLPALEAQGFSLPPGVLCELLPGPDGAPEKIRVWHPQGVRCYTVGAAGVVEGYQ